MKIDAARDGGSARLQLEGRLDREWAEHLSHALEDLLQDGVRSLSIDFAGVTYVSSAAAKVLAHWHQQLAVLRGDVQLLSLSPAVLEGFALAGWDPGLDAAVRLGAGPSALQRSSWHARSDFSTNGQYELSARGEAGTLTCRLHGEPDRLAQAPVGPRECRVVELPESAFGLGLGAIGRGYDECRERLGELIAVAGCVAYFPTDGARLPDYLVGGGSSAPRAVLASGLTCEGRFSQLVRFSTKPEAESVPVSELAKVGLDAVGGRMAGMVVAGETAGLSGVRLRRSPAHGPSPMRFEVPAVREWLSFAPEPIHSMTTTLIAGVVSRTPDGPLGSRLRPLGGAERLFGHFHAAVFSYHPLPQRTVDLTALVKGLFADHQLRDVLHLVWDTRGEAGVGESALVRGVGWVGPITQVG